jgi:integrase/recombinase XerD
MKVHLRQRKQTKGGRVSLYLEIYKGSIRTDSGKVKAIREYEYLDLYLVEKPQSITERQSNKETLSLAQSIKAKRELEIKSGKHGFTRAGSSKADFILFFQSEAEKRGNTKGSLSTWESTLIQLKRFAGSSIPFKSIDVAFCEGFKEHLGQVRKTDGKPLSSSTIASYYSRLRASLKLAVKKGYLAFNPADEVAIPVAKAPKREHLSMEELKALAGVDCRYPVLKNAFLFSCLTGLRWSDVNNLKWADVRKGDDGWRIVFRQEKTEGLQYQAIPSNALKYMGDRGNEAESVFKGLKYSSYMNVALQRWMMEAGITKNITFHCARHTYAVLQLQLGADIYTLMKLMGHSEVKTTQIYAEILGEKKREAVNRLEGIRI